MGISFLFSFDFASLLFTAICKASSDNHFAFLFLGDGLDHCLLGIAGLGDARQMCPGFKFKEAFPFRVVQVSVISEGFWSTLSLLCLIEYCTP